MIVSLLLGFLFAAPATAEVQPPAVELSCKPPTRQGRLKDCRVVTDRCEGAGFARRALALAREAKVDPADYPGAEPVQVLIPCAQIPPPATVDQRRPPEGDPIGAQERQRCRRAGGPPIGMPC